MTLQVKSLSFALGITSLLGYMLLMSPWSVSTQTSSFSLSLSLDGSEGDQGIHSLDVSPNQDVSIQIFGTDIQNASGLSARFEYDVTQVVYTDFDAGDVLPNPDMRVSEGTNPSSVQINIASLSGSATVNSGLVGTIRFRTTDAFSQTEILLVRAELSRSGQVESVMLNIRVVLQVAVAPSPDFDGSGFVDFQDFSLLIGLYGYQEGQEQYEAKYDLNGNGEIGLDDFLIFIKSYGKWINHAPVFTSETYVTHFIDENTPGSELIGSPISATDADGDIVTYHLSGTDVDLFAIDTRTGQLQTREDITYDYEYRTTYSVIVEVSDGQGGTARLLVIIKINDLKEPPSSPPSNFLVIPANESLTVHYATVPDERGRPPVRGYHAEIRKGEDGIWGDRKTIYGRTNTSVYYHELKVPRYHDPYLINGQLYQVRVRTWNSDGASDWSEPVSGTPVYEPPKEEPKLAQFQGEGDRAYAVIDLSPFTGEGGRIIVTRAALPVSIPHEEIEGVFAEVGKIAVSDAPDVSAQAGFAIPASSSLFDIDLKAQVDNQDVDIGDALQASVEICLTVPENISDPVIVHYESAWEMLERQRVAGDEVCGYTDMFSLFGVGGVRVNRAPVAVGRFAAQTLKMGDEALKIDVSARFSDPDGDDLTYVAASSDDAIAKVDVSGSVVTITPVAEGTATITVIARDVAGSNQTAEQTIAVTVNKADVKLSFDGATLPDQTYTVGTQITDLQLPEATGGYVAIGYTLTPALPDGLIIDVGTRTISGTPRVATEAREYKWQARDGAGNSAELIFSIEVKSANQVPIFSEVDLARSFAENTVAGENIGDAVVATDSDGGTLTYSLEGADAASFAIVSTSGQLQTTDGVTYNYEVKDSYSVVVRVADGQGGRASIDVTITLTDVTEVPGQPAVPTVSASTLNSLTISWTAPTNTGPAITAYDVQYRVGNSGDFTSWPHDGTGLSATITGLEQNTGYEIQVRAKNDEGTGVWSSSVMGTTQQNQAPVFTNVSAISVSENSTGDIGTVTATDGDSDDSIEGYGIVNDADGSQFEIGDQTGVLTFKVAPNYEAPADVEVTDPANAANNNEYIVVVEATSGVGDRELTATQTLTVTVTDETEVPGTPATPTIAEATVNSLKIDWTAPTNTGPNISAYDVRYILTSADENVDANWTEVEDAWTSGSLEYTIGSLSQNTSYDVQVRAENDEGTSGWSDTVVGVTQANVAPVISSTSTISVSENSTADVVTVTAADSDTDDNITGYEITGGADESQFETRPVR